MIGKRWLICSYLSIFLHFAIFANVFFEYTIAIENNSIIISSDNNNNIIGHDVTQLNCYNGDGSYDLHPDFGVMSAVTLLHQEPKQFTGGELAFSDYDYTPKLKNNSTILFPSFIQHEVKHIKGTGRYSINHFFFVHIR